jgi:hypothetical protein
VKRLLRRFMGKVDVQTIGTLVRSTPLETDDSEIRFSSTPALRVSEQEVLLAELNLRVHAQTLQVAWLNHPTLESQEVYAAALIAWGIFTTNDEAIRYAGRLATSALELRYGIPTPLTPRIDRGPEVWPTEYGPLIENEDANGCVFLSRTYHTVPPGRFQEDAIRDFE